MGCGSTKAKPNEAAQAPGKIPADVATPTPINASLKQEGNGNLTVEAQEGGAGPEEEPPALVNSTKKKGKKRKTKKKKNLNVPEPILEVATDKDLVEDDNPKVEANEAPVII